MLLRKLLALPSRPAVVLLHHYMYLPPRGEEATRGRFDLFAEAEAGAALIGEWGPCHSQPRPLLTPAWQLLLWPASCQTP